MVDTINKTNKVDCLKRVSDSSLGLRKLLKEIEETNILIGLSVRMGMGKPKSFLGLLGLTRKKHINSLRDYLENYEEVVSSLVSSLNSSLDAIDSLVEASEYTDEMKDFLSEEISKRDRELSEKSIEISEKDRKIEILEDNLYYTTQKFASADSLIDLYLSFVDENEDIPFREFLEGLHEQLREDTGNGSKETLCKFVSEQMDLSEEELKKELEELEDIYGPTN